MLDGQETVQIAWGELRWEGARQHAGRRGNRANSLRKASLGGSETVLDGLETMQIACGEHAGRTGKPWKIAWGELRWQGTRQHSSRGNGLGRAQCRAVVAALSELSGRFFRTNVIIAIVLKNCGSKT